MTVIFTSIPRRRAYCRKSRTSEFNFIVLCTNLNIFLLDVVNNSIKYSIGVVTPNQITRFLTNTRSFMVIYKFVILHTILSTFDRHLYYTF